MFFKKMQPQYQSHLFQHVWENAEAFNVGKSEIMHMFAINTEGVSEVIPPQNDL